MASWRILCSWIGRTDLLSAAAEQYQEIQKKVLSALEIERPLPLKKQSGPIRTLLDEG